MSNENHEEDNGIDPVSRNKSNNIRCAPQTLSLVKIGDKLVSPLLGGDLSQSSTDVSRLETIR